jgi:hypothetical protein
MRRNERRFSKNYADVPSALGWLLFCTSIVMAQELPRVSGIYETLRIVQSAGPGLIEVKTPWSHSFVGLGPLVSVKDVEIHGSNNANSMYNAVVGNCGVILLLDGVLIGSNGTSVDAQGCRSSFPLTRAQAVRAEALFGVTRKDRHEIGEKLRATFSVSPKLELVVRIENPLGAPPVQWVRGGAQRGPRDNQFSMRITRNGKPVPEIDAHSMDGLMGRPILKPGEAVEMMAPISSWGDISRPGRYVVQGAFWTELFPVGVRPNDLGRGDRWDRRFTGTVTFQVR